VQVRQSRSGESESTFSFFPFLAGTFSIRCITKYGRSERLLEIVFFPAAQEPRLSLIFFFWKKASRKETVIALYTDKLSHYWGKINKRPKDISSC
jgi:hypothetical protein